MSSLLAGFELCSPDIGLPEWRYGLMHQFKYFHATKVRFDRNLILNSMIKPEEFLN